MVDFGLHSFSCLSWNREKLPSLLCCCLVSFPLLLLVATHTIDFPLHHAHVSSFYSSHSLLPHDCVVIEIESEDGTCDNTVQLQVNQLPQGSSLEDELSEAARLTIPMTRSSSRRLNVGYKGE